MRAIISSLALALLLLTACSESTPPEPTHPALGEVVDNLISTYPASPSGPRTNARLNLVKDRDGWKVQIIDPSNLDEPVSEEGLFWSAATKQYQPDSIPRLEGVAQGQLNNLFDQPELTRNYAIHPYYGYSGWSKDVIDDFGDRGSWSDTLLYGLARAYSDYASSLFYADDQKRNPEAFFLADGATLSPEQLNTYKKYADLSIARFADLIGQNPKFETVVGSISMKHANQHMTAFSDLITHGATEAEAGAYLKPELYDALTMINARNYLNSCSDKAILFVGGDNDTYPLWYAQYQEGLRQDVSVLNLSLLNLPEYADRLREPMFETPPVKMSLDPSVYYDDERELVAIDPAVQNNPAVIPLPALMDLISDPNSVQDRLGTKAIFLPSKNFVLQVDSGLTVADFGAMPEDSASIGPIYLREGRRSYLIRSDYILLDILQANHWERPVYFSITVPPSSRMGMDAHLHNEGLALRLLPWEGGVRLAGTSVNTEAMYQNMTEKFDWSWGANWTGEENASQKGMLRNYRMQYIVLADALLSKGDTTRAAQSVRHCLQIVPSEKSPLEEVGYFAAGILYPAGATDEADAVTATLAEYLYGEIKPKLLVYNDLTTQETSQMQSQFSILQRLGTMVEVSGGSLDLQNRIQAINDELLPEYLRLRQGA